MNTKIKAPLKIAALVFVIAASLGLYSIVAQKPVVPHLTLTTYQGEKLALDDWRGKVVLVNFWATSCTTCIKEMPAIAATYSKYAGQGLATVAIAMQYDNPGFVTAYALKNGLPFKVVHDADGAAAKAFGEIRLTPTTFLIDKQGNIVKRLLGEPDFAALHAEIEALLKAPT